MRFNELQSLLLEANVYNVDVSYAGNSLSKFLKPYIANVSEVSQKALQKKLAKLLMNNEKFLKKVEKLPADAPEWAQQAQAAGQLMYFAPTPELEGAVEHISHYVAALEGDEKSDDPNKKANATRELAGVTKAENLDLLVAKSNEYFTRGTKKVATSNDGSTHIFDGANGYSWYRLDTLDAYKREGKVLQNCIGTHWVPSKADRIYVMKGTNGDTNVAIRTDTSNTIQEVKGKNNKPPVARYMPAVAELINHMKWKVQGNGAHDIARAGYLFHEGILYSRSEAIEKFVTHKPVAHGNGFTIDELTTPKMSKENRNNVLGLDYYDSGTTRVYGYFANGNAVMTLNVSPSKELIKVNKALGELDLDDRKNGPVLQAIRTMRENGLITTLTDQMRDWLRAHAGVKYDVLKKDFDEVASIKGIKDIGVPQTQRELSPEEKDQVVAAIKEWVHDDLRKALKLDDVKSAHISVLQGAYHRGYGEDVEQWLPVQLAIVDGEGKATLLTLGVSRSSHKVELEHTGFGKRPDPAHNWTKKRDETTGEVWVKMANEKKFLLPPTFLLANGVIRENDQYVPIRLSELKSKNTSDGSQIFDLDKYEGVDRLTALIAVVQKTSGKPDTQLYRDLDNFVKNARAASRGGYYYGDLPDSHDSNTTMSPDMIHKWIMKTFAGNVPNRMIRTKLDDNSAVTLFVTGDTVVRIGEDGTGTTARHAAKHEALAGSFNKLAKDLGLKFNPKAMSEHELAIVDDIVQTAHSVRAKDVEAGYKKSPQAEVKFQDGTVIKRMPARDAVDFLTVGAAAQSTGRRGIQAVDSYRDVYEIENDGKTIGAFTVTTGGTLGAVFGHDKKRIKRELSDFAKERKESKHLSQRELPAQMKRDTELMKYVVTAAEKLNFQVTAGADAPIAKPNGTAHKLLRALSVATAPMARTQAYKTGGAAATMNGWETLPVPQDRRLYDAGFVDMTKEGKSYMLAITPRGKEALKQLRLGNAVRLTHFYKKAPLDDGTKKPEPVAAPAATPVARPAAAAPRAAAPAGAGTKAERAQRLWDAEVAAGNVPTRAAFIRKLVDEVGMTPAGAGTYYHNLKVKHARAAGQVGESLTFKEFLCFVL